jgi:hypothetical protein
MRQGGRPMKPLILIFLWACVGETSTRANPSSISLNDDAPPPTCAGRELNFRLHDALEEILFAYCPHHTEVESCHAFYINAFCPPNTCQQVLCGSQLVTHAQCVASTAATGIVPDPCLAMYSSIEQSSAHGVTPASTLTFPLCSEIGCESAFCDAEGICSCVLTPGGLGEACVMFGAYPRCMTLECNTLICALIGSTSCTCTLTDNTSTSCTNHEVTEGAS